MSSSNGNGTPEQGVRRIVLRDVAEAANVSLMTASRAINGEGRVAPETRERVLREAERMGYRPSYLARSLRANETRLIGFVAPNLMLPVHVEIIQGARDVVSAEGYRLFLQVDADDGSVNNPFESDGDLVIADAPNSPRLRDYSDGSRTVGLMGRTHIEGIDTCGTDLLKATLDAFQHLLAVGYRRIGLIQHIGNTLYVGREDVLAAAGLSDDSDLVQVATNDRASVERAVHALMALPERPDAIAIVHVAGTPVALRELQKHRYVIGRDIGFIGTEVSSSDWGDLISPRMTAIRIPGYRIGAAGAERLIARLRGDQSTPRRHEFPAELIVRESTPGAWNPDRVSQSASPGKV